MEQATPSQQISQMESANLLASRTRRVAVRHSRMLAQAPPDDGDQAACQGARNKKPLRWELGLLDQATGKSSRNPTEDGLPDQETTRKVCAVWPLCQRWRSVRD